MILRASSGDKPHNYALDKYDRPTEDSLAAVNFGGTLVLGWANGHNFLVVRKSRTIDTAAHIYGPNFCWRICLHAGMGLHLIAASG